MSEGDAATDGVGWAGLGRRRRGLIWAGRRRTALARAGLGRRGTAWAGLGWSVAATVMSDGDGQERFGR